MNVPKETKENGSKPYTQLLWFAALWLGSVLAISVVSMALRSILLP